MSRQSKYPMISVDEAIVMVLEKAERGSEVVLALSKAYGHVVSQDFISSNPFPAFPASIMDGYALCGPIKPGIYRVVSRIHAGED